MTDSTPIPAGPTHSASSFSGTSSISAGSIGTAAGARKSTSFGDGAAFKSLLEQLEDRTKALELESRRDLSQDDLAGAVDNARASLEQMLTLKDQLLEAWRAAQQEEQAASRRV